MSKPEVFADIAAAGNDQTEKRRRIEKHRQAFLSGNKSGEFSSVNFAADLSDCGNESGGVYDSADFADFADYNKSAKEQAFLNDVRILTVKASVADTIKRFLTKRNKELKRSNESQKQAQKDKTSQPFWY